MRLMFIGADHEVTGSCYYLEAAGKRFLVDYGMEQGNNVYVNAELPCPASDIDFVLLTHAHIDHSGMLPKLYAMGFRGPVYATKATADLCDIMLRDSAHIQEFEADWRNRKGRRAGKPDFVPPYTMADADGVIKQIKGYPYEQIITVAEGIDIRFIDAGHLLGSASIEIWLREAGKERKIVFSGDIGNVNQPLIRDPQYIKEADYVVMESTYGDRSHGERVNCAQMLAHIIQETFDRGGNVVIPSFAVGRTQEILYYIRQIKEQDLVKNHGNFTVCMDSPLANEATEIFKNHPEECYDEEASELLRKGINPIGFSGLKAMVDVKDSKNINEDDERKVIISASGMCDAGRVKHHLKHNLWRKECTILFVGYQAVGTPGRAIVDGAEHIRLFGDDVAVNASIRVLPGMSGHADNEGLMKWAAAFEKTPQKVFVCHGEDLVTEIFANRLRRELGYDAYAPYSGAEFDLLSGKMLSTPVGVPVVRDGGGIKPSTLRARSVFARLVAAGQRLMTVIRHNEGGANKDLAKFTDQINALCDKWDR